MRLTLIRDEALPAAPEVVDDGIVSHAAGRGRAEAEIDRTRSGLAVSLTIRPRPDIEPGMRLIAELPGVGVATALVIGVEHVAGTAPETRLDLEVWQ